MGGARNLVLVGMPGCGKSRIGKLAAKLLDMDFVDLDAMVVKTSGMSIPEIFAKYGEARFRELEREAAISAAALGTTGIATGGGTIVQPGAPAIFRQISPMLMACYAWAASRANSSALFSASKAGRKRFLSLDFM